MAALPVLHLTGTVVLDDNTTVSQVWVVDGKFSFDSPELGPGEEVIALTGTVLPGLVDVHSHIGLDAFGATSLDTAADQAITDRNTGVLLVRDCGSPLDTARLQERSDLPTLIRCGQHLARTRRYIRNYALELDDSAELVDALAQQADAGNGWTKIVADWIDRAVGDLTPLWERDDLIAAIAGAHERGARVTAHTFATESIDDLLDAGIDSIEHGTGMTQAHMARAKALGVPVTATLLQVAQFAEIAAQGEAKFPVYAARMRAMFDARYAQVKALYEAGVQILVGTDAGGTLAHGLIAQECAELVRAGIPAHAVVGFASYRARDFLGYPSIAQGAPADAVIYRGDPRADIAELTRPLAVILRGKIQQ